MTKILRFASESIFLARELLKMKKWGIKFGFIGLLSVFCEDKTIN
jgi:hypothetical protein